MSSSVAKDIDELYPKTPWWTNLVAVILTAIASAIIVALSKRTATSSGPPTVARLITDTALFLPHALILFGIFADMFAFRGAYAIASGFGLLSLPVNKLLDYFWIAIGSLFDTVKKVAGAGSTTTVGGPAGPTRGGAVKDYTGCYIQGLETIEAFKPKYSSQTLVVTGTILFYYTIDLLMNKGLGVAFVPLMVGIILFILQTSSMSSGGCFPEGTFATTIMGSVGNSLILSFLFYLLMESMSPDLLPSKVIPTFKAPNPSSLKVDESTGKMVDASGMAWTFDANGNLIPDTCPNPNSPNSSGNPATEGSCPGSVSVN